MSKLLLNRLAATYSHLQGYLVLLLIGAHELN